MARLASIILLAAAVELFVTRTFQTLFVGTVTKPTLRPPARVAFSALRAEDGDAEAEAAEEDEEEEEAEPEPEKKVYKMVKIVKDTGLDLDGDKLDNLFDWYEEALTGDGGLPTQGFMKDLMVRSFLVKWYTSRGEKRIRIDRRMYTGENMQPAEADYEKAYENMVEISKEPADIQSGAGKWVGQTDDEGWLWLAAEQTPMGLRMYFTGSPPFGQRALALLKRDNVDEFWNKVDWYRIFIRLHKWNLWGGKATTFPFPVNGKTYQAKRVTRV
eukprot:CAMPEP_0178415038 /NCGR_PEP_ID=MMETSP0689_2-20121128/23345_1 /TAXON_ID=160604 /ORGANISM="Amphidinium massartii, Strain CS-259" /LENGTH=271 /DNA_ID=CAMNT_0020036345 /DNA_START=21 /DNA_END=836 /DNA_ORIENTATION=+